MICQQLTKPLRPASTPAPTLHTQLADTPHLFIPVNSLPKGAIKWRDALKAKFLDGNKITVRNDSTGYFITYKRSKNGKAACIAAFNNPDNQSITRGANTYTLQQMQCWQDGANGLQYPKTNTVEDMIRGFYGAVELEKKTEEIEEEMEKVMLE